MAQRRNDAALMVVQIKPRREECVLRMALRRKVVPSRVV
jgi:hypothetical protein